ncbi:hypothetical protein [Pseudonocardia sp. MH-G8]|uniref:hypothetical protein n=1 Tax=Pseudonocardia sp. MH-G8 TaxID=1854588 RepID=UPI0013047560|nr:hypothetical protein [Pseudonocardia sp. MH-G8]
MTSTVPLRRRRVYRLLTSRCLLRVVVCRLCCSVVLADGIEQHAAVHAAANGDRS